MAHFNFRSNIFIPHASPAAEHGFDGGVDRLDHVEAHWMIAVGGNAFDVLQQEVAEPLYLRQALPRRP